MRNGRAAATGTFVTTIVVAIVTVVVEIVATGIGGAFLLDHEMERLA
jgi:hypothetical protein